MKSFRASATIAPAAAVVSALTVHLLAVCHGGLVQPWEHWA